MNCLNEMDEVTRKRCGECDYMNNDVAINKKRPNCKDSYKQIECEVYLRTHKLENRVKYLRGEIGPIFFCGKERTDAN